jgi:uracil-DNA glycosylase family 4
MAAARARTGARARAGDDLGRGGDPRRPAHRVRAAASVTVDDLAREIAGCRACPRLVSWREEVARVKRRAYRDEVYWGRPVPGFGDAAAAVALVGLAPGAHGANRTGRMFTGDGTGDFLYAALHRAGLATQATAVSQDDGLRLSGVFLTNACRCVPPDNRPTPEELARCAPFLDREVAALPRIRVLVALGAIAWAAALAHLARAGHRVPRPRPRFGHGAELRLPGAPALLGTYHPSRQNTQTGRLTPAMLDAVLARAAALAR